MKIPSLTENYVLLNKYVGKDQVFVDSIRFGSNGLANYRNNEVESGVYTITLPNSNSFELVVAESKIFLETSFVTPIKDMLIKKSVENKIYYDFKSFAAQKRKRFIANFSVYEQGGMTQDSLIQQQKELTESLINRKLSIIQEYEGYFVSDILQASMNPVLDASADRPYEDYLSMYLGNLNLDRPSMLNTPLIYSRIMEFLDDLVASYPEEQIRAIRMIMAKCENAPQIKSYLSGVLIKHYYEFSSVGNDEVFVFLVHNYVDFTGFSDREKNELSSIAKTIERFVRGAQFNLLSLKNSEKIDELDAVYTLILAYDTNASEKQLDLIFNMSKSYESRGLKVCAISIGQSQQKLHSGQMTNWTLLSADRDLKSELYMKESLMLVLLDADKRVLARDITLDFLIDAIELWTK